MQKIIIQRKYCVNNTKKKKNMFGKKNGKGALKSSTGMRNLNENPNVASLAEANENTIFSGDMHKLTQSLENGELDCGDALEKLSTTYNDWLTVIKNAMKKSENSHRETEGRVKQLASLVDEMKEKLVCMQQRLIIQEEKFDEKCRELARYKVICQLQTSSDVPSRECVAAAVADAQNAGSTNGARQAMIAPPPPRQPLSPSTSNIQSYYLGSPTTMRRDDFARRTINSLSSKNKKMFMRSFETIGGIAASTGPSISCQFREEIATAAGAGSATSATHTHLVAQTTDANNNSALSMQLNQSSSSAAVDYTRHHQQQAAGSSIQRPQVIMYDTKNEVKSEARQAASEARARAIERDLHRQVAWPGHMGRLPATRRVKYWPY